MQHTEQHLRTQSICHVHDIQSWVISEHLRQLEKSLDAYKYRPDQPRVPSGNSDGGQWTSGGGGGGGSIAEIPKTPPQKPLYPDFPGTEGEGADISGTLTDALGTMIGDALGLSENSPITRLLAAIAMDALGMNDSKLPKLPPMSLVNRGGGSSADNVDPSFLLPILGSVFGLLGEITSAVSGIFSGIFGISSAQAAEVTPDGHELSDKITRQMGGRDVTAPDIDDAVRNGNRIDAINKATGGDATRYEIPRTGQSVIIDNSTRKVLQVGAPGFQHGVESGDKPGAVMRPAPRSGALLTYC